MSASLLDNNQFVITGSSFPEMWGGQSDILVAKASSEPKLVWSRTFGGSRDDVGMSVVATADRGILVAGHTNSDDGDFAGLDLGARDIFLMKLDSNGAKVWVKVFGGSLDESPRSIALCKNGDILMTGSTCSDDGDFQRTEPGSFFYMRLSGSGEIRWSKILSGDRCTDSGADITECSDGTIAIVGRTSSTTGVFAQRKDTTADIVVLRTDSGGSYESSTSMHHNDTTAVEFTATCTYADGVLLLFLSDALQRSRAATVSIHDVSGRMVMSTTTNLATESPIRLELPHIVQGTYIVEIAPQNGMPVVLPFIYSDSSR